MKDRRLAGLTDEFLQRIRPHARVEMVELKDADPEREGRDMVAKAGPAAGHGVVVALDEHGESMTSRQLSRLLGSHGSLVFLVGGADGLGEAARQRADRTIRLSSMTLTHEMARLLLVEQIYRGFSILKGLPYHRD